MLSASQILTIKTPEQLFSGDAVEAKKKFHDYSRQWHPDVCKDKDASAVFIHIKSLYKDAVLKIEQGIWVEPNVIRFKTKANKEYSLRYHRKHKFELGEFYIGDQHVIYLVDPIHKDLYNNAIKATSKFSYGSPEMEKNTARCLPKVDLTFELVDGRLGLSVVKTPDLLSLRDVIDHYKGSVDPKHVAWIQNTLYNLCCYLEYAGISHNDISPDTYFISPEHHGGALLGGWWYSVPIKSKLSKVPQRTFKLLPWKVQNKKIALGLTDLELVRAVGREALGLTGMKASSMSVPKPMAGHLVNLATEKAVVEYRNWSNVLENSFGPRRFVTMDLTVDKLYQ